MPAKASTLSRASFASSARRSFSAPSRMVFNQMFCPDIPVLHLPTLHFCEEWRCRSISIRLLELMGRDDCYRLDNAMDQMVWNCPQHIRAGRHIYRLAECGRRIENAKPGVRNDGLLTDADVACNWGIYQPCADCSPHTARRRLVGGSFIRPGDCR
jgi:hypothetical protein